MTETPTVTLPVSRQCEHKDCDDDPTTAYVVTGQVGKDGIAVYCDEHADNFADPSSHHTTIAPLGTP